MHRLAFSVYPVEMVCGCLTKVVKDLNAEIASDRVSKSLSPGTLITRRVNPSYKEVMVLNFGDYVQAHVPATKTNNNESRTTGCIALYPSRNGRGSWYFMSLNIGKRVHRYLWDVIPMSNDVIDRVNALKKQGQPLVVLNSVFKWDQVDNNLEYESESEDKDDNVFGFTMPLKLKIYVIDKDKNNTSVDEQSENVEAHIDLNELGALEDGFKPGAFGEEND